MNFQLNDIGTFNIVDSIQDDQGIRVLKKYLKELTISMVKKSIKHIDVVGIPPFVYRERQIHTIMAPAISELSDAFLMESAVNRQWSLLDTNNEVDSPGWVDYWCLYKQYNYYIELKHGFISYRTGKIRKKVKKEWQIAANQLEVINEEVNEQKKYAKGIFKIIFQVLPIYSTVNKRPNLIFNEKTIYDIQSHLMLQISDSKPANWSCVCKFDNKWIKEYKFINGVETYPAILFLVNVSEIIQK